MWDSSNKVFRNVINDNVQKLKFKGTLCNRASYIPERSVLWVKLVYCLF